MCVQSLERQRQRVRKLARERPAWQTPSTGEANDVLAPALGLPSVPVIVFGDGAREGESWKLPAIEAYVGERPGELVVSLLRRL